MKWFKQRKRQGSNKQEKTFKLDCDAQERFDRLKAKIPAFDEDEILASALKSLEQKVDRIIRKQIANKNIRSGNPSPHKAWGPSGKKDMQEAIRTRQRPYHNAFD